MAPMGSLAVQFNSYSDQTRVFVLNDVLQLSPNALGLEGFWNAIAEGFVRISSSWYYVPFGTFPMFVLHQPSLVVDDDKDNKFPQISYR